MEHTKPIVLFTPEQERQFLRACDDWQFPVFLTSSPVCDRGNRVTFCSLTTWIPKPAS